MFYVDLSRRINVSFTEIKGFIALTCLLEKTFSNLFIQQILIEYQLHALNPECQTCEIKKLIR